MKLNHPQRASPINMDEFNDTYIGERDLDNSSKMKKHESIFNQTEPRRKTILAPISPQPINPINRSFFEVNSKINN